MTDSYFLLKKNKQSIYSYERKQGNWSSKRHTPNDEYGNMVTAHRTTVAECINLNQEPNVDFQGINSSQEKKGDMKKNIHT